MGIVGEKSLIRSFAKARASDFDGVSFTGLKGDAWGFECNEKVGGEKSYVIGSPELLKSRTPEKWKRSNWVDGVVRTSGMKSN